MTPEQRENILKQQIEAWPKHVEGGRQGNPFATLCLHCYGRHKPPHSEICPHSPPPSRSEHTPHVRLPE